MNYRASKGPVASEAFPFAMPLAALTFTAFALDWDWLGVLGMIALVFVLAFFRNPERYHKPSPGAVVSGADGKVVAAGLMRHDDFPGGQCLRIAIFMSVFDCHINWSPVAGKVTYAAHFPGKFLNAMYDKCADENERKILVLEADGGHVVVAYGGDLLIVVVAERTAQLGMLRLEAHRAAEALQ